MARQATGLRAQRPLPGPPVGPTGAVSAAAAVPLYLPTDRRWRPCKALCDLPYRPTSGNATRDLFAFRKPQSSRSSPARQWSDSSIERQHPVDAALVPSLKSAGDICHTLAVLPALPELCPLLRRKPCPCMHTHRSPPTPTRLEGVAVTG